MLMVPYWQSRLLRTATAADPGDRRAVLFMATYLHNSGTILGEGGLVFGWLHFSGSHLAKQRF